MKKKSILQLIAFLLFFFGFLSLILSSIGLQFSWLKWLDTLPAVASLLIKVGSIIVGLALFYVSKTEN